MTCTEPTQHRAECSTVERSRADRICTSFTLASLLLAYSCPRYEAQTLDVCVLGSVCALRARPNSCCSPWTSIVLFWVTALLVIFTLVNIFVAIILKSYQQVVDENPDANDSSQFIAMVLMQAKRTTVGAIAGNDAGGPEKGYTAKNLKPTIMSKKISPIGKYLAENFSLWLFGRFETRRDLLFLSVVPKKCAKA